MNRNFNNYNKTLKLFLLLTLLFSKDIFAVRAGAAAGMSEDEPETPVTQAESTDSYDGAGAADILKYKSLSTMPIAQLIKFLQTDSFKFDILHQLAKKAEREGLTWCLCESARLGLRLKLIVGLLVDILKKYPKEAHPEIVHTDLGESGCLQSYLLALILLDIGYRSVVLNLINIGDPKLAQCSQHLRMLCSEEGYRIDIRVFNEKDGYKKYLRLTPRSKPCHSIWVVDPDKTTSKALYENLHSIFETESHKNVVYKCLDSGLLSTKRA